MRTRNVVLDLEGLPRPRGGTAHARRLVLASESDEQLGQRLLRMVRALRAIDDEALGAVARAIDLPLGELVASPFALRMIALGARLGVRSVRHETRAVLGRPVWESGVLVTGKYDAFRQDDPLVTYHPEHVAKWAPHEHLHRAVGFFHRPSSTRFERYVGARLNEILPVSTWYGLEHALRLENDGARFDAAVDGRSPSAGLERASWRRCSNDALRERCVRAAPRVRWTLEHAQRELDAVDEELTQGRVVRVVHEDEPHLDASSDAMAYVLAHDPRLGSEALALVLASYAKRVRFTRLAALRAAVEATLDALLFAPIELDLRTMGLAQQRRRAWDLASRVVDAMPDRFARIAPLVRAGADASRLARAIGALPRGARVLASGDGASADVGQLDRGLGEAAPRAHAYVRRSLVRKLATSADLMDRASLPARLATLFEREGAPAWLVELARLEALVIESRRSDPRVESLLERGPLPARRDPFVTASSAFRLAHFTTDVLALHAGGAPSAHPTQVLVGRVDGAVSLVAVDSATARAWAALASRTVRLSEWSSRLPGARDALGSLAAHGAIGWALG